MNIFLKNLVNDFNETWIFFKHANTRKTFWLILAEYIVGLFALFRANYNYIDDVVRVYTGYRGWENFSRYISEYGSIFLHGNIYLNDISPLPQLIAAAIMSAAVTILIYTFDKERRFSWWYVIGAIPFALSPYFLECFAFKFDAPYIALSVIASIFPLVFIETNLSSFVTSSVIGTLIMCLTYQASNGVFYCLLALYIFIIWSKGKDISGYFRKVLYSILGSLITMTLFKIFLVKPLNDYVSTSIVQVYHLPIALFQNITLWFNTIRTDLPRFWIILAVFCCCSFLINVVVNGKRNKYRLIVSCAFLVVCLLAFIQGVYLFLEKPYFQPRAMFGIGIVISSILIAGFSFKIQTIALKIFSVALCWCVFTFSFTYGNALAEQKYYDAFRIQMLLQDLNKYVPKDADNIYSLKIMGTTGHSPIVRRLQRDYPIIKRLVPLQLYEEEPYNIFFNDIHIYIYYAMENFTKCLLDDEELKNITYTKVFSSDYHDIYLNNNEHVAIVDIKRMASYDLY